MKTLTPASAEYQSNASACACASVCLREKKRRRKSVRVRARACARAFQGLMTCYTLASSLTSSHRQTSAHFIHNMWGRQKQLQQRWWRVKMNEGGGCLSSWRVPGCWCAPDVLYLTVYVEAAVPPRSVQDWLQRRAAAGGGAQRQRQLQRRQQHLRLFSANPPISAVPHLCGVCSQVCGESISVRITQEEASCAGHRRAHWTCLTKADASRASRVGYSHKLHNETAPHRTAREVVLMRAGRRWHSPGGGGTHRAVDSVWSGAQAACPGCIL